MGSIGRTLSLSDAVKNAVDAHPDDEAVDAPAPPRKERRKLGKARGVPRGGKAGLAGEDATWNRDRLSRHHIFSAHHFAEGAAEVEALEGDVPPEDKWRYRAYVTGAVLSAVSYLSASINELYLDLRKVSTSDRPGLRRELDLLVEAWPRISRVQVLQRYQLALSVADSDQYNPDSPPYVDADSLIRLRDALISYEPTWTDERGRNHALEDRIKKKFPPSPLVSSRRPWFPDKCLGSGCAKWAVATVQIFTNDFYRRMSLPGRPLVGGEAPPVKR